MSNSNKKSSAKKSKAPQTSTIKEKGSGKKSTKTLIVVSAALLVLAALCAVFIISARSRGAFLRAKTVSENESAGIKIDGAAFTYYFYDYFYEFCEAYPNACEDFGISAATLDEVVYNKESDKSWFDVFAEYAQSNVGMMLSFASYQKAEGQDAKEENRINAYAEAAIARLKSKAEDEGLSLNKYLSKYYGKGVREKDVRAFESFRARSQLGMDRAIASVGYASDEEIDACFAANENKYLFADYLYYIVEAPIASISDEEERAHILEHYEAHAYELAEITDPDEYKKWVEDFAREDYKNRGKTLDDDTLAELIDDTVYEKSAYSASGEINKWIYSPGRKAGDRKIFENRDHGTFGVVLMTSSLYMDETPSENFRHILISYDMYESEKKASDRAHELLASLEGADSAAFAQAAKEYSDDAVTADAGGLFLNLLRGDGSSLDGIFDWCADKSRKANDIGLIKEKDGVHIVMYEGKKGLPAYRAQIANEIRNKRSDSLSKDIFERYPTKPKDNPEKYVAKLGK